jgi:predicted methyltransferase
MRADAQAEFRRFTPELRDADQKLAEQKFKTLDAGLAAILKSPHRAPQNPARDAARHPLATLKFFGVTPKSVVFEYGPGEGWYTEILAPLLLQQGQLFVNTADPAGPADSRATFYAERFKLFLDKAPELYGKVTSIVVDPKAPDLKLEGTLDSALVIRGVHGMVNAGTLDVWLATIHHALKKGGSLGIEQHRASAGSDPLESAKKGYVPEAWLISQIEAAGFKLAGKSEINANPKDTKDYADGVWALPPTLKGGETDRQKYVDIGESDRMTLKFSRVEPKK